MIDWITVFDVSAQPFRWGNAGEGLVALALLALGVAAALALKSRVAAVAALAAALCAAGVYLERTVRHRREHDRCVEAERRHEGRSIEGIVERYRPAEASWPYTVHARLEVGGEAIAYPLLAEGCGFHQAAAADEAALREGAKVRLRMWEGQILKVEVKP